jgi:hypothetical protein
MRRHILALAAVTLCVFTVTADAQSRSEIYELQEKCGKRAEQLFEKDFPLDQRQGLESFENHYNVRLNRCFMLEQNTMFLKTEGKSIAEKILILIDVNDNKPLGSFEPLGCDVQDRKCNSEQEFRTLIKFFMED